MENNFTIRKERDLGEILSDSFQFLKLNFKLIQKPILSIVLFWALISTLGIAFGLISANSLFSSGLNTSQIGLSFFTGFIFLGLLQTLGIITIYIVTLNFIKFRDEKPDQIPTTQDLFQNYFNSLFRFIGLYIPLFFLLVILILLILFPGIWFLVVFTFFLPVAYFEKLPFRKTLSRTRFLTKGEWWNSFLSFFIPSIIGGILSGIIKTTISGIMLARILIRTHGSNGSITSSLDSLGGTTSFIFYGSIYFLIVIILETLIGIWYTTCISFQYFSLVEKKDQLSTVYDIDSLGLGDKNQSVKGPEEY